MGETFITKTKKPKDHFGFFDDKQVLIKLHDALA